jgi:hypothetical protein
VHAVREAFCAWHIQRRFGERPLAVVDASQRVLLSLDACINNPESAICVRGLAYDVAALECAITDSSKASSH